MRADAGCTETTVGGVPEILAVLERPAGNQMRYRERVFHPALLDSVDSSGILSIKPDGTLVRDQTDPKREVSELRETVVVVRSPPDGEANLLPMPDHVQQLARTLRFLLRFADGPGLEADTTRLADEDGHWRLGIGGTTPHKPTILIRGCGTSLDRITLAEGGQVRRVISLSP